MSISLVDMFMFLQSVRNPNSFKLVVRRLEEVALSVRGMERVQELQRWLVAIKEIDKDHKYLVHIEERNNEQVHISDDGSASPRKSSLVSLLDWEFGIILLCYFLIPVHYKFYLIPQDVE